MMRVCSASMVTIGLLILALCGSAAQAIVLHTDDEVPAGERPHDDVIGRWRDNASCVVIGPNMVLTTTHQGGTTPVTIAGVTYDAMSQGGFYGGPSGGDDIRIAELFLSGEPANLGYWVDIHTGGDTTGDVIVLGGYGMGRGTTLTTGGGTPYGYQWDGATNTTLRWGQNRVDREIPEPQDQYMTLLFDAAGVDPGVDYEAAVAEYDSGGGWFTEEDGKWYVAGLTIGAEHALQDQSWFANNITGAPDPDQNDAIRTEYYASWIASKMALVMPTPGDTDRDGDVDYDDLLALNVNYGSVGGAGWADGNFDGDGDVDMVDMAYMGEHYGEGIPAGLSFGDDLQTLDLIPEPASLMLMLLPVAFALRRRR